MYILEKLNRSLLSRKQSLNKNNDFPFVRGIFSTIHCVCVWARVFLATFFTLDYSWHPNIVALQWKTNFSHFSQYFIGPHLISMRVLKAEYYWILQIESRPTPDSLHFHAFGEIILMWSNRYVSILAHAYYTYNRDTFICVWMWFPIEYLHW